MWNIGIFHMRDVCECRPACQGLCQRRDRRLTPLRYNFHRSIVQIAGHAMEGQSLRLPCDEPPEADALHAAMDQESPCDHGGPAPSNPCSPTSGTKRASPIVV